MGFRHSWIQALSIFRGYSISSPLFFPLLCIGLILSPYRQVNSLGWRKMTTRDHSFTPSQEPL